MDAFGQPTATAGDPTDEPSVFPRPVRVIAAVLRWSIVVVLLALALGGVAIALGAVGGPPDAVLGLGATSFFLLLAFVFWKNVWDELAQFVFDLFVDLLTPGA